MYRMISVLKELICVVNVFFMLSLVLGFLSSSSSSSLLCSHYVRRSKVVTPKYHYLEKVARCLHKNCILVRYN